MQPATFIGWIKRPGQPWAKVCTSAERGAALDFVRGKMVSTPCEYVALPDGVTPDRADSYFKIFRTERGTFATSISLPPDQPAPVTKQHSAVRPAVGYQPPTRRPAAVTKQYAPPRPAALSGAARQRVEKALSLLWMEFAWTAISKDLHAFVAERQKTLTRRR
jgi:hypothetical protein